MCSNHFNIFALALKFRIFVPNFKISFIVFLSIIFHCLSNLCSLFYSIIRRTPVGDANNPSYPGSRAPDLAVFIQCVNSRDPKAR